MTKHRKSATAGRRKRLSPQIRRSQILDAAAKLIAKQGYLPLSIEALAQAANSSKALIYTYFATQYDLFNALLKREIEELATSGAETASRVNELEQAALLCSMLYFERVARFGPLLHILITDLYMSERVDAEAIKTGNAILQRLIRLAGNTLNLAKKELKAAIVMIATIPEEAGALAFQKELDVATARQLCHSLTLSSLQALRTPGRVTVAPDYAA